MAGSVTEGVGVHSIFFSQHISSALLGLFRAKAVIVATPETIIMPRIIRFFMTAGLEVRRLFGYAGYSKVKTVIGVSMLKNAKAFLRSKDTRSRVQERFKRIRSRKGTREEKSKSRIKTRYIGGS